MVGAELVVGYVFAWFAGKARRAAGRADAQVVCLVDEGVDRLGGRLHELVAGRLRNDPALERLEGEAERGLGEPSARVKQRVVLALEDAAADDPGFDAELEEVVRLLEAAHRNAGVFAEGGGLAAGGDVNVRAQGGSFAAGVVQGNVTFANPRVPGTGES
jgi:hypothetical protein